jgi:NAD(P)H-hydrate epimerase
MATLTGLTRAEIQNDRPGTAQKFAAQWNAIVVLKGAHTVIAAPDGRAAILPFANPALATAGTGDVLAGAIVGMLAQGLSAFDAGVAGAYLHAYAGEMARSEVGDAGVVAGDLLPRLPRALRLVGAKRSPMTVR